jgi:hypothetical protein
MSAEKRADADEDDDLEVVPEFAGIDEGSNEERKAAKKGFFPSSMGLSFLVPKGSQGLTVILRWGDYTPTEIGGDDGKPISVWRRKPEERTLPVTFTGATDPVVCEVPGSGGLELHIVEKLISAQDLEQHLPAGTRSVSVFLVNNRPPDEEKPDAAYAFQAKIEVSSELPFVPRPDMRGALADDWDDRVRCGICSGWAGPLVHRPADDVDANARYGGQRRSPDESAKLSGATHRTQAARGRTSLAIVAQFSRCALVRSCIVCRLSQSSALVPKKRASRRAVSAVTARSPLPDELAQDVLRARLCDASALHDCLQRKRKWIRISD